MEAPAPAQAFPLRGPLAEGGSSTFKYLPLFQPHAAAMARPASCATPANKGVAWSEEEHQGFLNGLQAFGKGSWKQISKYYTPTRTPTQVASHAQKHFLRLRKAPRHARAAAAAAPSGSLAPAPAPAASAGAPSSSSGASLHLPSAFVRCAAAPAPLPAPDAAGVTVGIPMLLSQPGAPPPPPPGPGGAQMLRVIPGRISAPVSYVSAPEAPRGGAAKRRLAASPPPPPPRAARAATLRSLDALRGQLRGRCGAPASPSGSALSESSRAHAALDALAGVAAALADSAAWP